MKIAINARFASRANPTGMQRAATALVDALVRSRRDDELCIFGDATSKHLREWKHFPDVSIRHVPAFAGNRLKAQLWEQICLSRAVRKEGCDLLLNPLQTGPWFTAGVPQVTTVHDLHFLHHPEWFGQMFTIWNRWVTLPALRKANHLVAISDYVLNDIRKTLNIEPEKCSRIYNIGPRYSSHSVELPPESERPPSILCVNAFQPHKNLAAVVTAYRHLKQEFPGLQLRLVGRPQENFASNSELFKSLSENGICVLGYVSDEELKREYAQCTAFCFPSFSEGFGLPVLEAAAAGALVVTSDRTCLPEICGHSAIFVNPHSIVSITDGLKRALSMRPSARERRIRDGRRNLERFTAKQATDAYFVLMHKAVYTVKITSSNFIYETLAREQTMAGSHRR